MADVKGPDEMLDADTLGLDMGLQDMLDLIETGSASPPHVLMNSCQSPSVSRSFDGLPGAADDMLSGAGPSAALPMPDGANLQQPFPPSLPPHDTGSAGAAAGMMFHQPGGDTQRPGGVSDFNGMSDGQPPPPPITATGLRALGLGRAGVVVPGTHRPTM